MKQILSILIFLVFAQTASAQPYKTIGTFKPYKWMIGVSWSAIDDNGSKFGKLFDVNNSWNLLPYPSTITVDRYFKYGWSMEFGATYSKYKLGKLINDSTNYQGTFFSFDVNAKYSFYQLYAPSARWIDPYLIAGVGYTYREEGAATHAPTVNIGGGINLWIYKGIGIRLNSTAKLGVYPGFWETPENYLHHSAGLVFRFGAGQRNKNKEFNRRKNKWIHKGGRRHKQKGGR
ncbi:MAG: hypothetical protein HRT58_06065 [Crocinitomicaceae bacterium]|nr:hypothetical protein [Flavobacteriales bacterium]NQZ35208.1 hypothetical protein [Crocinitomicaceae bacterium]